MHGKKPFLILLSLIAACTLFAAGLNAQLIEPTRSLEGASDGTGLLNVLSEPPGMDVQLDGKVIGKTPIFSARFPAGPHVLRIKDSETGILMVAGKTFAISWFKGSFIEIPDTAGPPAEIAQEPQPPPTKPVPEEPPAAQPGVTNDPYYWPLNPRGPIY
jgi:PEGA domain